MAPFESSSSRANPSCTRPATANTRCHLSSTYSAASSQARCWASLALPLVVHVLGRVEPGALLGLEPHVGPCLMRVACQQQSVRHAETAIIRREGVRTPGQRLRRHVGHSSVRIAQRSGKAGLLSVVSRYSAPAVPPVPTFVPMVRCTIFTCR